jgi:hypothetical protein
MCCYFFSAHAEKMESKARIRDRMSIPMGNMVLSGGYIDPLKLHCIIHYELSIVNEGGWFFPEISKTSHHKACGRRSVILVILIPRTGTNPGRRGCESFGRAESKGSSATGDCSKMG